MEEPTYLVKIESAVKLYKEKESELTLFHTTTKILELFITVS